MSERKFFRRKMPEELHFAMSMDEFWVFSHSSFHIMILGGSQDLRAERAVRPNPSV